ncbi:hypothetical protein DPMN_102457 [Dreissena polymorpha]|uniref:Uncharacterized protein n=1 Tax=Dreissena polymorpha TaxID=45954 RepID=A0A9D4LKN7_DREPO|nr:hypothetical protein DPMN_102457 [Dreissena polymorpha]
MTSFSIKTGRLLKEKQIILSQKHEESRRKIDSLNVGGGVSLWPEMEKMRLTATDIQTIVLMNIALSITVAASFYFVHGL